MRQRSMLLLFLGLSVGAHADSLSDENTRLKQQISALQSRVESLERSCTAAGSGVVVQLGAAAPAAAMVQSAPAAAATSVTAAANLEGTPQPSESSLPPPKPRQKYAEAGCDRGLFTGPEAGRWQKPANWTGVTKGLTTAEVETAIGVEHYDVQLRNGRTQWQYGRCSSTYDGAVEFLDGRVVSVTPPDR